MPCLCDATGRRRRGGPIRDPPGIQLRFVELMTEIFPEIAYRSALPSSSSLLLP